MKIFICFIGLLLLGSGKILAQEGSDEKSKYVFSILIESSQEISEQEVINDLLKLKNVTSVKYVQGNNAFEILTEPLLFNEPFPDTKSIIEKYNLNVIHTEKKRLGEAQQIEKEVIKDRGPNKGYKHKVTEKI